ncbi:hypothetical protein ETQ85_24975 [Zoogloea oleivorans]|uniref:Uncharacterized protein n=1 Tax=Zoogloea oleivorans TaxID=1552750 RepID=A0A6C2CA05_9RHOO|nr:hypothetical protein [Zoogloea oleivorans]TYC50787.1 hypothetical protein ETQ85_24975 [Zoogloea oleivorans]
MHNRIYTLVEKYPIAVSNGENGDLDGDFDGIDWRDIKMLGRGLVDALTSMGLMAPDECYIKTSLCRDSPGNLVYPAIKISTSCDLPDQLRVRIDAICFRYAQGLTTKTSHASSQDLLDDSRLQVQLTTDEEMKLTQCVQKTLLSLPVRLKHPIVIDDHDNESIVIVEGKLSARPSKLVGQTVRREVQGIIDNLGFSDFAVRILDLDGVAINGNYSNHSELDQFWKSMRSRDMFNFEVCDVIDDVGKRTTTIRRVPPRVKEQTLR